MALLLLAARFAELLGAKFELLIGTKLAIETELDRPCASLEELTPLLVRTQTMPVDTELDEGSRLGFRLLVPELLGAPLLTDELPAVAAVDNAVGTREDVPKPLLDAAVLALGFEGKVLLLLPPAVLLLTGLLLEIAAPADDDGELLAGARLLLTELVAL